MHSRGVDRGAAGRHVSSSRWDHPDRWGPPSEAWVKSQLLNTISVPCHRGQHGGSVDIPAGFKRSALIL